MNNISFGEYVFPNNPAGITVENTRQATVQNLPGRGQMVQSTSKSLRKAVLEGEFFADSPDGAQAFYTQLKDVYSSEQAQLLCLPAQRPFYAHFVQLTLKATGDGRTLAYTAAFLEKESEA